MADKVSSGRYLIFLAVVLVIAATVVVTIPIHLGCAGSGAVLACPPPTALFVRDFAALVGYVAALVLVIAWLIRMRRRRR